MVGIGGERSSIVIPYNSTDTGECALFDCDGRANNMAVLNSTTRQHFTRNAADIVKTNNRGAGEREVRDGGAINVTEETDFFFI